MATPTSAGAEVLDERVQAPLALKSLEELVSPCFGQYQPAVRSDQDVNGCILNIQGIDSRNVTSYYYNIRLYIIYRYL